MYDPKAASSAAAKGMRSRRCKGRFIKHNFDDFDNSEVDSNGRASDWERRAKAKYKKKANKIAAKLEAMIEGKIRVKTEEKRSLRKKEKSEKEAENEREANKDAAMRVLPAELVSVSSNDGALPPPIS